jgi:hypothetical protein
VRPGAAELIEVGVSDREIARGFRGIGEPVARALATGGKLIILAGSRRALAQAIRTPAAGRRHTALTHRRNPTGPASQPRRP